MTIVAEVKSEGGDASRAASWRVGIVGDYMRSDYCSSEVGSRETFIIICGGGASRSGHRARAAGVIMSVRWADFRHRGIVFVGAG